MAPPAGAPARRSPLAALALPVYVPTFVYSVGIGALAPVMVLAALQVGFSHAQASVVVGVNGLVGVATAPWSGRLVNRFGGRFAFGSGTALAAAAAAGVVACLARPGAAARAGYVAGVCALAVAANLWSLARQSTVAEDVPPRWRARGMSMLGGMLRIGQLVGPALGSLAIGLGGLAGSFWLQLATALVGLGFVWAFPLPESHRDEATAAPSRNAAEADETRAGAAKDRRATWMLALGVIVLQLVRANRAVVVPLWGDHLGIGDQTISLTFAAAAVLDTLMFYPAGRLMDARGRRAALLPTLCVMGAGFLALAASRDVATFAASAMLIGFGNGFGSGIVMTIGADLSPDEGRSTFLGRWQAVTLLGQSAGPFAVSGLVATLGIGSIAWTTGAVSLAGAAYFAAAVPAAYRRLGMDDRGGALP